MQHRRRVIAATYYGLLCLLMALIVPKALVHLVPTTVAHHVASDSEGYTLALLLALWVQVARPRLAGSRAEWPLTLLAALVSLAVGTWLYRGDVLGTVKTLNETFFALAVLIPYVQLRRPLPRAVGPVLGTGLLVLVLVLEQTGAKVLTTALAEGVVMVLIAPVLFDVADRGILDPAHPSSLRSRELLWVGLLGLALASIALRTVAPDSDVHDVVDYSARAQEAWVGMLILSLYSSAYRSGLHAHVEPTDQVSGDGRRLPLQTS